MVAFCGEALIVGGAQTETVMAGLLALPQTLLTSTQYVVVFCGVAAYCAPVAPAIGCDVSPGLPLYHW